MRTDLVFLTVGVGVEEALAGGVGSLGHGLQVVGLYHHVVDKQEG